MNYFKRIETIVIVVVILLLGVAYGMLSNKADAPTSNNTQQRQCVAASQASGIRYSGVEGCTALELLKSGYRVETKNFGNLGEFVQSINGVAADGSHFWSFYVNGSQSQVGAGTYVTKSSDVIEWKLDLIQ